MECCISYLQSTWHYTVTMTHFTTYLVTLLLYPDVKIRMVYGNVTCHFNVLKFDKNEMHFNQRFLFVDF